MVGGDSPEVPVQGTIIELGAQARAELFVGFFGVFAAELCEHHAHAELPHVDRLPESGGCLTGLFFVHMWIIATTTGVSVRRLGAFHGTPIGRIRPQRSFGWFAPSHRGLSSL